MHLECNHLIPVIADIFMVHMEITLFDRLMDSGVCQWHGYFDDTFVLVEPTIIVSDVLHILSNFQPSIEFTYEVKVIPYLSCLDGKVTRSFQR
jgi:hypothetical protein